ISDTYFRIISKHFKILDLTACSDIQHSKAKEKEELFDGVQALTVEELVANPDIEIILNLTNPVSHKDISMLALKSGKHVYSEKPLAMTRDDGYELVKFARSQNLLIGCAPDTFMGAGQQTCRNIFDSGTIGTPVTATAFMMCRGHESWHPNPEYYYEPGGGPMFDMGPYYLTALCNILGPAKRVTAITQTSFSVRTIGSGKRKDEVFEVKTPTHIVGLIEFVSGASANIITTFDVWHSRLPHLTIYGSNGTMLLPNPNNFEGPVEIALGTDQNWQNIPLTHAFSDNSRGIGLADMAYAIRTGNPYRANGELAYHVLDIMESFFESAREGKHIEIRSTCTRPDPLPIGLSNNFIDAILGA
ncbi:MAG: Gfo/Idh/MocA family oxidoreductase, partial [Lentisphaerae bacterium]|nr:Gfo/Idh/MocA family oxidoreductase [Lentisphaerota bacterium]